MKKLIAGAILLGASSMAFAQPGCGVGAMIWKGQSGIAPHVLVFRPVNSLAHVCYNRNRQTAIKGSHCAQTRSAI